MAANDPDDELLSLVDDDDGGGIADLLVEQDHGDADHDAGGLELDDSQQDEIRQIFLTSLPQYLEPVDQMVAQVFSGQDKNQEAKKTLNTTLASISEAAERLGIDDVSASVERVREELLLLDDDNADEVEEAVQSELDRIKSIASGGAPVPSGGEERAQTLFVALKDAPGVDAAMLEKLTAAGLVTVDQVKMARFDEIVAVTGLSAEQVKTLLAALNVGAGRATEATATPSAAPVSEAVTQPGRVDAELAKTLRAQVEEEVELGELRVDVLRAQELLDGLQQALVVAERNQERLHRTFSDSCDRLADRIEVLCKARAKLEDQKRNKEAQQMTLERLRDEVRALDSEERRAHDEHTKLSQRMDALVESVEQMLTPSRRT